MAVDASPGAGRVLIAGGDPLAAEPTWTRYDNLTACRCSGFDWERGRQTEFDTTDTGTARVYFHDRNGTFAGESFVGDHILLQVYDPVTATWQPVFRGHIDDISSDPSPSAPELTNVQLDCVDIFDYLSGCRMVFGEMGDALPTGSKITGSVFYEDGPVDDRITQLLTDAGIATDMKVVFTGNIDVLESLYDSGDDDILSAVRDASDAEFPSGVANAYVDRWGRVVWHGRRAKLFPDETAEGAEWDFTRWTAATREDVTAGRAQIREFAFNRPRTRIINSYQAWPRQDENHKEIKQKVVESLVRVDTASRDAYGYRGQDAPALIIKHKTNGNTGIDECGLFGDHYTQNYSVPRKNIQRCVFQTLHPGDPRAADVWALMSRADVSDIIQFYVDEASMAGEEFYIEGISGECRVGPDDYDVVTVTPNLSPKAYYVDVFDH